MFLIFASEVAACIGKNKHVEQREALLKIWKRTYPNTYYDAIRRLKDRDLEETEEIIARLDIRTKLNEIVSNKENDLSQQIQNLIVSLDLDDQSKEASAVRSYVYTERGKCAEDSILDSTQKTLHVPIQNRNAKFYKKLFSYQGLMGNMKVQKQFAVGGKVDGITEEADGSNKRIVEVKNRQFKLFPEAPAHEYIQMQVYMYLTDIKELLYVQSLKTSENEVAQTTREVVKFDKTFWQNAIEAPLEEAVCLMDQLNEDEKFQQEWFRNKG